MIVRSLCDSCYQVYEIRTEPADTGLLKELMAEDLTCLCPRLCGGRINLMSSEKVEKMATDPRFRNPLTVTVKELYKAVNGGGLPDEIPQSYELAAALFKAYKVESVFLEQDGRNIYLHEVRFENGSVLHLAAGRHGAVVLKITSHPKEAKQ